jgi:anti-anti-sigma factor
MNDSIRSEGVLPLTVAVSKPQPDVHLLRVAGELDIATAPLLADHLRERAGTAGVLVLDLSDVTLLAASGVALIVDAHRDTAARGHLHLIGVTGNRPVARVLDLTGVLGLLDVHDDLPGLLAHLDGR